ncbi:non-ribosomal peptide synthetase [Nonomuraea typhae]|uniref:non-ribosomal peptide synthetase n=1 Tax=Nonomuraea typhae TaxID=2603600 RepID=UPI0012F835F2|nr:non-ribosomal peptide synthetase [Nonomuraea typhae]
MYTPVHELVAARARSAPGRVAIVHQGTALTYGALHTRAQRLARQLVARGVGPETAVGVFLDRSPEFVLTALGVLHAGGAYVPLDPAYPPDRPAFMPAATSIVITTSELADRLPPGTRVLTLDADGPVAPGPLPAVHPENLAYTMVTSGSTGVPRGVSVRHAGITRLVRDPSYVRLTEEETVLHASPVSFDAATFEIWGALAGGARLVVAPAGPQSAADLGALLRTERVTTAFFTTGLFHLLVDECLPDLAGLRQVLVGGDVLSPTHARAFVRALPATRLINAYGPTEVTTFTTSHHVALRWGEGIPIGRPIDDTWIRILDDDLQPTGTGHLYAGGAGLARGYHGDPALTAERFIPDPYGTGERLYATGDLARLLPSGAIEFLGRADQQIKRRGFRIEPGDIEEALRTDPRVRDAAVIASGTGAEHKILTACVVLDAPAPDLRERLRERLPDYLMPDRWAVLDALPLNPSGKVDRAALATVATRPELAAGAGPVGELESAIAAIWGELFEVERVGRHDDFFDLGGHSLLASRMSTRLRRTLGSAVPVRAIFDHPTVAELAEHIRCDEP